MDINFALNVLMSVSSMKIASQQNHLLQVE